MPHIQTAGPAASDPVEPPDSEPQPEVPGPSDGRPALAILDASAAERDGTLGFTVRLSRASEDAVSVAYATKDGTATAILDYQPVHGTLTFAPHATDAQKIEVAVHDDAEAEGTETFTVRLSDARGATLSAAEATGTIADDDLRAVTVEPTALNVDEGTTGSYTVVLESQPTGPVTVTVTVDPAGAELTVDPDELSFTTTDWHVPQRVTVTARDDADAQADAPVKLVHTVRGGGYDGTAEAAVSVTIVEDEVPTLAVAAARALERSGRLRFEVTLSRASDAVVTVDYATGASGDTATEGQDYTRTLGTLRFAARSAAPQMIDVTIRDDDLDEPDERLTLTLRNPSPNAALAGGGTTTTATGSIEDDDDPPRLTIADGSLTEGAGDGTMGFVVRLDRASGRTVTVRFETADETAAAGSDFAGASGTLAFEPGGPLTRTIAVAVANDGLDERDEERFTVTLSQALHATLDESGRTATGTIRDVDEPPQMSIAGGSVSEGDGSLPFLVTLDEASGRTVTVAYTTADGTATAGVDYTAVSGTLTFGAGTTARTIVAPILVDSASEETETFTVTLSAPSGVRLGNATATGTITDDDEIVVPPPPTPLELASLQVTGGGTMYPAFASGVRHYALTCQSATTVRVVAQARSATAQVTLLRADSADNQEAAGTLDTQVIVGGDHDIVIELSEGGDTVTYAVHCLPSSFPRIRALVKTDQATDGLLLTTPTYGDYSSRTTYMAILDKNGVPRFHRLLTDTNFWASDFRSHGAGRYSVSRRPAYNLQDSSFGNWEIDLLNARFEVTSTVGTAAPLTHTDAHDFQIASDGDYVMLSYWSTTHDFNQFQSEYSTTEATRDSVIQRRTAGGTQEFSWNSWDHRDVLQVGNDCRVGIFPNTYAHANAFHLLSDGDIVVSLRGCAQVLRIDGSTGAVEWKLGGTAPPEDSDTEHLEIVGDSAGEFCGQHHVTLTSSNTIVMYDNGVQCLGPRKNNTPFSRAVEYNISSGTQAVFRREYRLAAKYGYFPYTGGVHVLGNRWLISWGSASGTASVAANEMIAISEVEPGTATEPGTAHLHLNISKGTQVGWTYRVYGVSESSVDIPWNLP